MLSVLKLTCSMEGKIFYLDFGFDSTLACALIRSELLLTLLVPPGTQLAECQGVKVPLGGVSVQEVVIDTVEGASDMHTSRLSQCSVPFPVFFPTSPT